jgi:hypothetical protein
MTAATKAAQMAETLKKRIAWCDEKKTAQATPTAQAKTKAATIMTTGARAAGPTGYLQRQVAQPTEPQGPASFDEIAALVYGQ